MRNLLLKVAGPILVAGVCGGIGFITAPEIMRKIECQEPTRAGVVTVQNNTPTPQQTPSPLDDDPKYTDYGLLGAAADKVENVKRSAQREMQRSIGETQNKLNALSEAAQQELKYQQAVLAYKWCLSKPRIGESIEGAKWLGMSGFCGGVYYFWWPKKRRVTSSIVKRNW